MKTIITVAVLSFCTAFGATITTANADPLNALESACRTGIYSACSEYNAAIVERSAPPTNATMIYGFDPFAIVPATHSERTPKAPTAPSSDLSAGNPGMASAITQVSQ